MTNAMLDPAPPGRARRSLSAAAAAVAAVAVSVAAFVAPAAGAPGEAPHVAITGVDARCHRDGLSWAGTIEVAADAGSTVSQRWRVSRGELTRELATTTTPIARPVSAGGTFDTPQFFGPAWSAGFPFTFEHAVELTGPDGLVVGQVVQATCHAADTVPDLVVTDLVAGSALDPPGASPGGDVPAARPVTAEPRYAG